MAEEEYKRIFSKNLRYYMQLNGKTQMDLMNDLGLSSSTVSNWCTGLKLPRMDKVQKLADYFNINKSDLIEDKPSPSVTAFPAPLPAQIAAQYGEDMRELVEAAAALDPSDRRELIGTAKYLTRSEKYGKEKGGSAG